MPKRADPRPASVVVESINERAAAMRASSTLLSERIQEFEQLLAKLPSRVDAFAYGSHPDWEPGDNIELGLHFTRSGKDWLINWCTYDNNVHDFENTPDWKPLNEATLKIKVAAVKIFPLLLEKIDSNQEKLKVDIETAAEELKELIAATKLKKEGK